MPLPMVHLAVAMQLTEQPSPAFLLGSIAPDAIHMRLNATSEDKTGTHFGKPPDHARIQALLAESRTEFTLGYVAHILTDELWVQQVIPVFEAQVAALEFSEQRRVYYEDTDQIDFNLYHQAVWRPEAWQKLTTAAALDFPPLLTQLEIQQWQNRTLRWFTELKTEPNITPRYLTDAMVSAFVGQAATYVDQLFRQWISNDYLKAG